MSDPHRRGPVLVTGAGGFLGRATCSALRTAGVPYRAWLGPPDDQRASYDPAVHGAEWLQGDICDPSAIAAALEGVVAVIHLAGPPSVAASLAQPAEYVRAHTLGTSTLLDGLRRVEPRARFVYASSAEVYGRPKHSPVVESAPCRPRSPYGAAKLGAEAMVRAANASWDVEACVLRPFSVYGAGMNPASLLAELLAQARAPSCRALQLRDGRPIRDFCHVDDVARALVMATLAPQGSTDLPVWNVASGEACSTLELARAVAAQCRPVPRVEAGVGVQRPGRIELPELVADISGIGTDLGWTPSIPLARGLAGLLACEGGAP